MRRWLWGVIGLGLALAATASAQDEVPGYTTQTKTAVVTAAATDVALWTPASGSRFALQGCWFSSPVAALVELEVSDVDVIPPQYLTSYGDRVVGGTKAPIYTSATDAVLTYTVNFALHTASRDTVVSILCVGYEYRQ